MYIYIYIYILHVSRYSFSMLSEAHLVSSIFIWRRLATLGATIKLRPTSLLTLSLLRLLDSNFP